MNILIAPNAFKGTIPADRAAALIEEVLRQYLSHAEYQRCPIADGGDGTCFLLGNQLKLNKIEAVGLNAIGLTEQGLIFLNESRKEAWIDVSTLSGLAGLPPFGVNAQLTSTFGTGQLIMEAIRRGAEHIILGLGGSATVDMGTGILRALGYLFLDKNGREIPMFSPGFLERIAHIQRPVAMNKVRFTCLCDVKNTFFGSQGAIPVFGPQKGLSEADQHVFESAAKGVFELLKAKGDGQLTDQPGFGAAGGIALGLSAFFSVKIEEGAHYFFEQVNMQEKVSWADWVITGEGKFDSQSAAGKGSYKLLGLANKHQKKTLLITSGGEKDGKEAGFDDVVQLPKLNMDDLDFKQKAAENLKSSLQFFLEKSNI
ncbi:glycerate kinase [Echinicola vietnamensis]|uniref:Glycerate kinase n=1 Tax=Echinicola vietnamensis (strain DSM 17526 / LMG 23754 / KMM 6221) TaxID=926556 RepID=L0G4J4_ECHVK|nr:glycerate kinase [Echinicola vietnamensis]AGA80238.1 glycerate kinase [Echinicola vietnamensis DSM 17526]